MSTAGGVVVGVEALLRWTHPVRGPVPALTTVGIAEENGLIGLVGAWVLERSCADRGQWLAEDPGRPLDLYVRVSVRQLTDPVGVTVSEILEATRMDPVALVLELTEGVFIEDGSRAGEVLAGLRALGVRVALDDFGTGYCSLGYLRRFPVDTIKGGPVFVADIGQDPSGAALVAGITDLAHVLGLTVTAEGVATQEQQDAVLWIGSELA